MLLVSFLIKMKVRSQQSQCKCLQDPMALLKAKRRNHSAHGSELALHCWLCDIHAAMVLRNRLSNVV